MHPLLQQIKGIVGIMDAVLIVLGFSGGAFYLGYGWEHPLPQEAPRTTVTSIDISAVQSGAEAYRGALAFLSDSLYKLQDEHPDGIVGIATSAELGHYEHFRWVVSIAPDFQSDFAISVRGVYLTQSDQESASFAPLNFSGREGPPYRGIAVDVPSPEKGTRILVSFSVYRTTPQAKLLSDIKRMLTAHVE